MTGLIWCVAFLFVFGVLAYQRASLVIWTISFALFLLFATRLTGLSFSLILAWLFYLVLFIPLNVRMWRQRYISQHLLNFYRQVMPAMSRTEREAISAGTVTWEGDLFRGNPDWKKLLEHAPAALTQEEQAFLAGPVEALCAMLNDWDITHNRIDLSPQVWKFIRDNGFFGLIIPKRYGGKEFSAYAHSQILIKIGGISITAGSSIAVPNSLGPAELLLHYGTEEQKNYYLPRLARGEEVPCFALTSPVAGSDAGSMTDHGVVCQGEFNGKNILGIRLNFDKRYITLAPIATVIGLAFKLYDPDHLLGSKEDLGITCALIPRNTPGIEIGRRHFPLNTAFQNGPIRGKDIFIPLDWIIGGPDKAGKGWVMLMECLAAGRAISLPASAVAGAKVLSYAAGAYARIRRQFNMPIGKFEGVEEPLARIAAYTYIMDAARTFATASIDSGEKPSVASAIVKYHVTELGRKIAADGMDIHGGKGICLGPKNYIGRGYEAAPIAITVEGANILTRNMIIFGQGVIRCHPYILSELEAARLDDPKAALKAFDDAVMKHIAFGISNFVRSLVLGITSSYIVQAPKGRMKRYYQQATRFSSAFALLSDVCMMVFGGSLKRKESISSRLGDILSYLYLLSAVLKHYHDQGENHDDLPVVRYACLYCLFEIQERFDEILKNFPNRWLAWVLKIIIFPLGERFSKPRDAIGHKVAQLLIAPTATRERLAAGAYLTPVPENIMSELQDALIKTIEAEPIEKLIKTAKKEGRATGHSAAEQAQSALNSKAITIEQFNQFMQAEEARKKVIAVDDFSNEELVPGIIQPVNEYADITSK
ncbi:Acyl-coenzyme A dehydrogenase [Aquicella siphonis]|uniref:Acyl-coenzyme A dehydrogenase n=1 Tax=Aquicella siphonis TaxID=254247 RepID=A0A5E4PHT0_9COXI|nr:acyl-CoA dehydrogenase [Aquicella siphonis]VVC75886.1 Acyl-coenzyme A dehydrogenase [Aquicella siphonis]